MDFILDFLWYGFLSLGLYMAFRERFITKAILAMIAGAFIGYKIGKKD